MIFQEIAARPMRPSSRTRSSSIMTGEAVQPEQAVGRSGFCSGSLTSRTSPTGGRSSPKGVALGGKDAFAAPSAENIAATPRSRRLGAPGQLQAAGAAAASSAATTPRRQSASAACPSTPVGTAQPAGQGFAAAVRGTLTVRKSLTRGLPMLFGIADALVSTTTGGDDTGSDCEHPEKSPCARAEDTSATERRQDQALPSSPAGGLETLPGRCAGSAAEPAEPTPHLERRAEARNTGCPQKPAVVRRRNVAGCPDGTALQGRQESHSSKRTVESWVSEIDWDEEPISQPEDYGGSVQKGEVWEGTRVNTSSTQMAESCCWSPSETEARSSVTCSTFDKAAARSSPTAEAALETTLETRSLLLRPPRSPCTARKDSSPGPTGATGPSQQGQDRKKRGSGCAASALRRASTLMAIKAPNRRASSPARVGRVDSLEAIQPRTLALKRATTGSALSAGVRDGKLEGYSDLMVSGQAADSARVMCDFGGEGNVVEKDSYLEEYPGREDDPCSWEPRLRAQQGLGPASTALQHRGQAGRSPGPRASPVYDFARPTEVHPLASEVRAAMSEEEERLAQAGLLNGGLVTLASVLADKLGSLEKAFEWMNTSGSGEITLHGFETACAVLKVDPERTTGMKAATLFKALDSSRKSVVSWDDWVKLWEKTLGTDWRSWNARQAGPAPYSVKLHSFCNADNAASDDDVHQVHVGWSSDSSPESACALEGDGVASTTASDFQGAEAPTSQAVGDEAAREASGVESVNLSAVAAVAAAPKSRRKSRKSATQQILDAMADAGDTAGQEASLDLARWKVFNAFAGDGLLRRPDLRKFLADVGRVRRAVAERNTGDKLPRRWNRLEIELERLFEECIDLQVDVFGGRSRGLTAKFFEVFADKVAASLGWSVGRLMRELLAEIEANTDRRG